MSLDVYLNSPVEVEEECICQCCDNMHIKKYFPNHYQANITHNLGKMADKAGVYNCLWRPDENGITHAKQLIEPLTKGYELLTNDYKVFVEMNPSNGYGSYEGLRCFVADYLQACIEFPDDIVEVSR